MKKSDQKLLARVSSVGEPHGSGLKQKLDELLAPFIATELGGGSRPLSITTESQLLLLLICYYWWYLNKLILCSHQLNMYQYQ